MSKITGKEILTYTLDELVRHSEFNCDEKFYHKEDADNKIKSLKSIIEKLKCCGNCKLYIHNPDCIQSNELGIIDFTTCEECIYNEDPDSVGLDDNWKPKE